MTKQRGKPFEKGTDARRNVRGANKGSRSIPDILRKIGEQQKQTSELGKAEKLDVLLNVVYNLALQGEKWAVEFIADRTEGKAITTNVNINPDIPLYAPDLIEDR